MQIEPENMRAGEREEIWRGSVKQGEKIEKQEAWTTSRAIIHTVDKLGMKAQSVTPSLIIVSHHTAHSVTVCVCECVYRPLDHCSFQENRLSLDLLFGSLL